MSAARAARALPRRRADHQPARRHAAAPEDCRRRPARLPRDRPGPAADRAARRRREATLDFLEPHCAFFTFGENFGGADCGLPVADALRLPARRASRSCSTSGTTAARRRRPRSRPSATGTRRWRERRAIDGETYGWSKHPRVAQVPRPAAPHRAAVRARAERATSRATARSSSALGWRRARRALRFRRRPRRLPRLRRAARAASSPSPRTRTSASGPAGSATAAPRTSPPAGRSSRRTPASATSCRPARACSPSHDLDDAVAAVEAIDADHAPPPPRGGRDRPRVLRRRARARRPADAPGCGPRATRTTMSDAARPRPRSHAARLMRRVAAPRLHRARAHPALRVRAVARRLPRVARRADAPARRHRRDRRRLAEPPIDIVRRYPTSRCSRPTRTVGPYRLVQQVIDDTDYDAYLFQDADDWSAPDRLERLLDARRGRRGAELIGSQEVRVFCDEPEAAPIQWPLDGNAPFAEQPTAFPLLHPTSSSRATCVMAAGGFSIGPALRRRRRVPAPRPLRRALSSTSRLRLLPPDPPGLADDRAGHRDRHARAQAADGGDVRARAPRTPSAWRAARSRTCAAAHRARRSG